MTVKHTSKQHSKPLTARQKKELKALAALPDDKIDTREMPEVRDWSNAKRGIMDQLSLISRDLPPRLPFRKLPDAEQGHAHFVWLLLQNLGSRCKEFESALALFDFCLEPIVRDDYEEAKRRSGWMHIAAQAAASTIYLFDEDIEFLGKNLARCPTLRSMIDPTARRIATKKISQYFPDFAGVRHSGQHYAKLYGTPEGMAKHIAGPIVVIGAIVNRTLQTTFKKMTIELDITPESLTKLKEVRDLYWGVFRPLDPAPSIFQSASPATARRS